jgi:hypothetical protein
MEMLCCNVAALVVALLYYIWRSYHHARLARQRVLRERVAYLLWVIAERIDSPSRSIPVGSRG